jgi:excisionase family DNA binding protein
MATSTIAPTECLTPSQAAEIINVPTSTLAVWRSTNRVVLPYFKAGHHVRYRRADLEKFIAQNMRGVAK